MDIERRNNPIPGTNYHASLSTEIVAVAGAARKRRKKGLLLQMVFSIKV
jgi:hypothetical protein